MPTKRLIYLVLLCASISKFSLAAVFNPYKLEAIFEQNNIPITRSFSIRAKEVNSLKIETVGKVELIDVSLEYSNGKFLKLSNIPSSNSPLVWKIENKHIKKVTFTAKSLSEDKANKVLIELDSLKEKSPDQEARSK